MALGATIVTHQREIHADDYFLGLFTTALRPGELIVGARFAQPQAAHYRKHEQPASRFAMVGVAVARLAGADQSKSVRVAITGLGNGVLRWHAAEQALTARWHVAALESLAFPPADAMGDVHASAEYRAHLAGVMCRRAVASLAEAKADTSLPAPPTIAETQPQAPAGLSTFFKRIFRRP